MTRVMPSRILLCAICVAAGLMPAFADDESRSANVQPYPPEMKPFADKLLEAAKTYEQFGRVDNMHHWAPFQCELPSPGKVAFSASKDEGTHGRKLYSLFASDRNAYVHLREKGDAPFGQTIVKESWLPEETKAPESNKPEIKKIEGKSKDGREMFDHFFPYVQKDGKWFKASKKVGLYIMVKYDPKTEGTDEGWIYGTVSADLKQVTSVGKVASCMECHVKTKTDRQFGISVDKRGRPATDGGK
jgi:hypothetical protein